MSRILTLFLFACFSFSAAACFRISDNNMYLLEGGVEYCLESEYQYAYVVNSEFSSNIIELSDIHKTRFEISYPRDTTQVPDKFRITPFENIQITVKHGLIYINDAPKIRKKRSLQQIGVAVGSSLAGSAGSALGGGSFDPVPTAMGTLIGTGIGLATGPFAPIVGPIASNAITQNIINNSNKPRPPLTIMPTNRPTGSGADSHAGYGGSNTGSVGCIRCHQ